MGGGTMYVDFPSNPFQSPSSSLKFLPVSTTNQSMPSGSSCTASYSEFREKRDRLSLGAVPSKLEVENAVSALEKYMMVDSSSEPELKWLCHIGNRINNVLSMMQSRPSFKRLAISISSDNAVWDAIKNNEMVRKLSESPSQDLSIFPGKYSEIEADEDLIKRILNWILDIARAKVTELMFKFQALVNHVFQHQDCNNSAYKSTEQLEDEVKSSLILSMVILLIVIIARVQT